MQVSIRSGDTLETTLYLDDDGKPMYVQVDTTTNWSYGKKTQRRRTEPFFLCADQAETVALELIRLAGQLREAEKQVAEVAA